ncbi:MAG: rhodanese-like domain-containing protein [Myxococcales bacterium]|nr:rhodanese-like domain-containing protein [Myxococcales bacterium]
MPGNLVCGEPSKEAQEHSIHAWAPLRRSYAGVPELPAEWLAEHLREVRIIDVREADEFEGELGHIEGAELVPLAGLGNAMGGWERDKPIVVVCRSGGRSAQAALILEKAGFDCVANLAQGMIGWRAGELPPARGSERPEPA